MSKNLSIEWEQRGDLKFQSIVNAYNSWFPWKIVCLLDREKKTKSIIRQTKNRCIKMLLQLSKKLTDNFDYKLCEQQKTFFYY